MALLLRRLLFFWFASFAVATAGYGLLWLVGPDTDVFYAALGYISGHHNRHPLTFIAIPSFFYGLCATLFADRFARQSSLGQLGLTLLIVALTVLLSSPVGGMLYYGYLKQSGRWPGVPWEYAVLTIGPKEGLGGGWLILLLSFPYNLLGLVSCFYLTRWGAGQPGAESHFVIGEAPNRVNEPDESTDNSSGFHNLQPVSEARLPTPPTNGTITLTTNLGAFIIENEADMRVHGQFITGETDPSLPTVTTPSPTIHPPGRWANLETVSGTYRLYALIDTTGRWAFMSLIPTDGYGTGPAFRTENPDPAIDRTAELAFVLSNGQLDHYPAHYCYPLPVLREVMILYVDTGLATTEQRKLYVNWVRDA